MKKIRARFQIETPKLRPFYGCNGFTSRTGATHKTNHICPIATCNYSSRNWIVEWKATHICQQQSVSSTKCPLHNLPLVDIGCASKMPKVGSKERIRLIEKYKS